MKMIYDFLWFLTGTISSAVFGLLWKISSNLPSIWPSMMSWNACSSSEGQHFRMDQRLFSLYGASQHLQESQRNWLGRFGSSLWTLGGSCPHNLKYKVNLYKHLMKDFCILWVFVRCVMIVPSLFLSDLKYGKVHPISLTIRSISSSILSTSLRPMLCISSAVWKSTSLKSG